ncbi:MAG: flagellar hook-associated protein FlgK [Candidatus Riflebacteria bacterium HGW-Riflebacteria-2]|jgi:flagellar hook-associated protein 1 FlgK|nr:MAG: flagellar hook-associated protein FlgK [Candidatus Riflebacteria bacterium HGW-Riflebacteria-2]
MAGTFFGLNIGKSGIFTQRKAMEVTSHNIANANTEGYSRQKAVIEASRPYMITSMYTPVVPGQVGTGATVAQIQQFRDEFIDAKITKETTTLEWKSTADSLMKQIEAIVNEPGTATVRDQLDKYWSAWEDLANDASNTALRRNLVEETESLISMFQEVDDQLRRLQGSPTWCSQASIESQIRDTVGEVNELAKRIAGLNEQIGRSESNFNVANDLRDQRQKSLEDLAKLVNVTFHYDEKDFLNISCGTHALVQNVYAHDLNITVKNGDTFSTVSGSERYPEFSDNTEVASAVLTHTDEQRNITITVSQIAEAHEQYSFLTFHPLNGPLSDFGITSGSFVINGREFFIDAENTDMQGLATMLDEANINVNAHINEAGQIILKSTQTGKDYGIETADGTSNLFTVLNLQDNKVAQDAMFSINGQAYASSKNSVSDALDGVTILLRGHGVANIDLRPVVTSGKLKGLLEVRDGALQDAIDGLNKLAYTIAVETNQVHRTGYGIDGVSGRNYFKPLEYLDSNNPYKNAIQNLAIEDYIKANLNTVAAAGGTIEDPTDRIRTYNGDGDGSNAIKISQLKYTNFFNDGKSSFNDFYNQLVTDVAAQSKRYETEADYSKSLLTQLDAKRQELSGVSLDEELANLIRFQHAYNAAAKVITVVDEMLDKIINGMI